MSNKKITISILVIFILFSITLYYKSKTNIKSFYSFEEFAINKSTEETFLFFSYDTDSEVTEVKEVDIKNKVKNIYTIDDYLSIMLQFSQIKNDYSKVYINNYDGHGVDLLYYDFEGNKFIQENLELYKEYSLVSMSFYGGNIILIVEDTLGKYYLYNYTKDILYEEIPYELTLPMYNQVIETKEKIYIIDSYRIIQFDKNTEEFNLFTLPESEISYNYDGIVDGTELYQNIVIPYKDYVLISPIGSNYLYQLKDNQFTKMFKYKDNSKAIIEDIYFLSETKILLAYDEEDKSQIYLIDLMEENYNKVVRDYINEDYLYEFLYTDDKYFYVSGRRRSISIGEGFKREFLIFDRNTYELINIFTTNDNKTELIIKN